MNESVQADNASATVGGYSPRGLFPGVFEVLMFLAFTGMMTLNAMLIAEGEVRLPKGDGIATTGFQLLIMGIALFILGRRHKKAQKKYSDYPATARVRDLGIFCLAVYFANLASSGLASRIDSAQQMGVVTVVLGLLGLALFSKCWSLLSGPRSSLWGGVFMLGALGNFCALGMSFSALFDSIQSFSPIGDVLVASSGLLALAFGLASYGLQAVAFLFGGLGLLKESNERSAIEPKLLAFYKYSITCLGFSLLFAAAQTVPKGLEDPKFPEFFLGSSFFPMAFMMLLAGNRMKKHYRAVHEGGPVAMKKLDLRFLVGWIVSVIALFGLGSVFEKDNSSGSRMNMKKPVRMETRPAKSWTKPRTYKERPRTYKVKARRKSESVRKGTAPSSSKPLKGGYN